MPYKNKDEQKSYQREWKARNRAEWLNENGPCVLCSSWKELQVDHVDRNEKVDHRVWSWSKARRARELKKCQVLCTDCHKKKTASEKWRPIPHGTDAGYSRNKCRCDRCCFAHHEKRQRDYLVYGC